MNHTGFSSHSLILHSLQVLAITDATLLNRRQKAEHGKAYSLANQKLPQLQVEPFLPQPWIMPLPLYSQVNQIKPQPHEELLLPHGWILSSPLPWLTRSDCSRKKNRLSHYWTLSSPNSSRLPRYPSLHEFSQISNYASLHDSHCKGMDPMVIVIYLLSY